MDFRTFPSRTHDDPPKKRRIHLVLQSITIRIADPFLIVILVPLSFGVAITLAVTASVPDTRSLRDILIIASLSMLLGLVLAIPMALANAYRSRLSARARRLILPLNRFLSLLMAGAFGYTLGCATDAHSCAFASNLLCACCVAKWVLTELTTPSQPESTEKSHPVRSPPATSQLGKRAQRDIFYS